MRRPCATGYGTAVVSKICWVVEFTMVSRVRLWLVEFSFVQAVTMVEFGSAMFSWE